MSDNNVELKGIDLFGHFVMNKDMTPKEALKVMRDHNQETKQVESIIE